MPERSGYLPAEDIEKVVHEIKGVSRTTEDELDPDGRGGRRADVPRFQNRFLVSIPIMSIFTQI